MRDRISSRRSYRNVLIAAAVAAGLEISSAYGGASRAPAVQPRGGDEMPRVPVETQQASNHKRGRLQAR